MQQQQQQQQQRESRPEVVGARESADQLKERLKEVRGLSIMAKEETLRLRLKHVGPSCALFFQEDPLKMVQGRGQYLYDDEGNQYLDCINNVSHVGHANRRVLEAVQGQLAQLNTNSRFLHDSLSSYARRLTSLFPAHLSVCYLVNSGSEANDLAVRLARAYTRHKDIVCVDGAYHGNLTTTMAFSPYKASASGAKWVHVAPMPCQYSGQFRPLTAPAGELAERDADGLLYAQAADRLMAEAEARGRRIAAMFVESMVSCGGQFPLPAGYLLHLERCLRARQALLVCDEVQTGFGRCGEHLWAFQLAGAQLQPDIVTLGKPMGNGFPVAAVVTRPEIARAFQGEYFNTFGGNPASCAAAHAVLDELQERQLQRQAKLIGDHLLEELRRMQAQPAGRVIGDVRGHGFFIGVELVRDLQSGEPAPEHARFLVRHLRSHRILISTEGKHGNVLKFKPPMVFDWNDARRFLDTLRGALAELDLELRLGAAEATPASCQSAPSSAGSSRCSVSSSSWLESSDENL